MRSLSWAVFATTGTACISHASTDTSTVLQNPDDPTQTVATTPSTADVCGTICDALIEDYGVPQNLKKACVFECASGFNNVPQACYELVACIADKSLCSGGDISAPCESKAGDCFAQWSLANGTCRGCWEPSRTVHGKQIVTYLSDGTPSSEDVPEDFSQLDIVALLPRKGGDPYRFPGTGNTDGTYVIPNVPGCGVWIKVGTTYTWASNADVDTSYVYPGRRNAQVAAMGTTFDVQVNNLVPWTQNDWLYYFVPQLGDYVNGAYTDIEPAYGMTIGDNAQSYAWSIDANGFAMFDAAQKDVVYIGDMPTKTMPNGALVRTLARVAKLTGLTAKSGVSNPMTANLLDVTTSQSIHIDFKRSTFFQFMSDMNPASQLQIPGAQSTSYGRVDVVTHPGRPMVGGNADLVFVERDGDQNDISPLDIAYGSPFPSNWGVDVTASVSWYVPLHDRNGKRITTGELIMSAAPHDVQGSEPIAARLSPPENFLVNGQSAFTEQAGETLTPTIAWNPPAIGTPTLYFVEVHKLDAASTVDRKPLIATINIPMLPGGNEPALRSFTLPPGLLESGSDYYFHLYATDTANEHNDAASVVSAEYRP